MKSMVRLPNTDVRRRRILVRGMVQGIGFRPWVWRVAQQHKVTGFVGNESEGAFIEIEGLMPALDAFESSFRSEPPPLARIDHIEVHAVPVRGEAGFHIVASRPQSAASTPVSPDLALCADCEAELFDPGNRRFGYPFINCTHCGPRFTIIEDLPYDRPKTTMRRFAMCAACAAEYEDPADRRFHAQPNACWDCGPTVWLQSADDRLPTREPTNCRDWPSHCVTGSDAIREAQQLLDDGKILAIKGIGGFHLACDATNETAVRTLRTRKGRAEKPFAVMVRDTAAATRFAMVSEAEARLLEGREAPIVLLHKSPMASGNSPTNAVAPESPHWGVMLAYSPLHHLLLARPDGTSRTLVMTSANWSEEPIVRENQEALDRLATLADAFLLHNRDIGVVADDSVVRVALGQELPLRRSRGYAPLPVMLPREGRPVLAVGAELKATFCITKDRYAYLSQHIGDAGNLETQQAMERALRHMLQLFRVEPEAVVCDAHPGYTSAAWAQQYASAHGLPLLRVQHHRAHVGSLLAEHPNEANETLLSVVFDGTGYGDDGSIWGGEFLLWKDGIIERVAWLKPILLPGGDAAIRHPWRCSVSHLQAAGFSRDAVAQQFPKQHQALPLVWRQIERNTGCVPTSSMGRLFDAVAAAAGLHESVAFEAQAAMQLEAIATISSNGARQEGYSFGLDESWPAIDAAPMWMELMQDRQHGADPSVMASRFHAGVAMMVAAVCQRLAAAHGFQHVGLSGGVFQNVHLLSLTRDALQQAGFACLCHRLVPPNDGGIALGQAWLAQQMFRHPDPPGK
jgi:hydrogenase maturation protein HypF